MKFVETINYTYSKNASTIISKLNQLPDLIACDFETASKWTDEEKEAMKTFLEEHDEEVCRDEKREIRQYIESNGLSHPSLTYITHLSVAWSPTESFVAILDNETTRNRVLRWLVNTERKQIWHNLSFDGKHIMYHTGKLPKNYEDSEVLAKTLLNHVNVFFAKVGLKHLMGHAYGDWGVEATHFNLSNIYNEKLIEYAGIDACATYKVWLEMQEAIKENDETITD